jgi:hypothetical protein
MGASLALVAADLAACIYVGYLAQATRGHTGAVWGFVTLAPVVAWHVTLGYVEWIQRLELVAYGMSARYVEEDAFTVAHVLGLLLLSQAMAVIVWTLPNRKGA